MILSQDYCLKQDWGGRWLAELHCCPGEVLTPNSDHHMDGTITHSQCDLIGAQMAGAGWLDRSITEWSGVEWSGWVLIDH
ncbi:hypothetical protein B296_00057920 [Ensete ventricosum]|uniref:Uncharacterized protein n=1 Tax=Ensete ventricosum TaxID=4639 RepID=A0A426X1K2_ENSVE|nr:hypothetical protein B296_00057920 [Ensete ventricosum]